MTSTPSEPVDALKALGIPTTALLGGGGEPGCTHSMRHALRASITLAPGRRPPQLETASLVHLDVFSTNVLVDEGRITAILDFGPTSVMGDRRLEPITAAAYLDTAISPTAQDADRSAARDWLHERGLSHLEAADRRWLGAYWSGAREVPRLVDWSPHLLGAPSVAGMV